MHVYNDIVTFSIGVLLGIVSFFTYCPDAIIIELALQEDIEACETIEWESYNCEALSDFLCTHNPDCAE